MNTEVIGSRPIVSVVIPVYNGANFLRDAIDSALAQTYKNLEVIVVNDGSSDDGATERIAKSYGDKIRYFAKENGGVSSALNLGIEKMSGEYFSWLSHDDMYYPGKVADQVARLTAGDGNEIVYSGYDLVDESGVFKGTMDPRPIIPRNKDSVALFILFQAVLNGCAMLIPRALFQKFGYFDPRLRSTQDYALWLEFFRHPEVRLTYSPFRGVMSRQHAGQGTNAISNHVEACSDLWISMMDGIDASARARVYGNDYAFYHRIGENLAVISNYARAVEHARRKTREHEPELDGLVRSKKVSVVIPFCNRTDCTIDALESVLKQTFANLEVILVDDGSTIDVSPVRRAASADCRVKYVSVEHAGAARARNVAVQMATGDYIAFLDSDDLWMPTKVEQQLRYMLANGYDFSCSDYVRSVKGVETTIRMNQEGNCFPQLASECHIATPTVMASRSVVRSGLLSFPEGLSYGEDVLAWLRVAHEYEVGVLHEPVVLVRVGEHACAVDPRAQAVGLVNIAMGELSDYDYPEIAGSVAGLLRVAAGLCEQACLDVERSGRRVLYKGIPVGIDGLSYSEMKLVEFWRAVKNNGVTGPVWRSVKAVLSRRGRLA